MDSAIQEYVPLAPLTSLRVGGPARYFVEARCEQDLVRALEFASENGHAVFILGGGSNLVVSDSGFPGLVIRVGLLGATFLDSESVCVAAGENWDGFVAECILRKLSGVECLSGIPGTVGGTPVQNVGAYGQEVSETITSVRVLDRDKLQPKSFAHAECGFAYRTSIFNSVLRNKTIILDVTFRLRRFEPPRLAYADLQKRFAGRGDAPSLREVREAVLEVRSRKGMVITPGDPDCLSAGSFFKNPVVNPATAASTEAEARRKGLLAPSVPMPRFGLADGNVKIPAAWLIECAGFNRGYCRGSAAISGKHTLAIVNRGGATAAEIMGLADEIRRKVNAIFGIDLHPEPVFVGFEIDD